MKLIKPSFEIIEQDTSGKPKGIIVSPETIQEAYIDSMYKHIELCSRTCYHSQYMITEDSAKGFVDRMTTSKHYAMLEHGTVYLKLDDKADALDFITLVMFYQHNKYSVVNHSDDSTIYYITTNLRVIIENNRLDDLQYICEPTEHHEKRYTVKFITNIQTYKEFTRHRVFSFAIESTRYCNYSKERHGGELNLIEPVWIHTPRTEEQHQGEQKMFDAFYACEKAYMELIKCGWTAQEAATVLPQATKAEVIMTGFASDWKHFFDLRALGTTGKPHPQAQELASPLMEEFIKRNYIKYE